MVTQPFIPRFGLRPRGLDPRELRYRQLPAATAPDPTIDRSLLEWLPDVYHQDMSDCVANATVSALLTCASMAGHDLREISRMALYSWGRQDMGTFPQDGGMYPGQGCDSVRKRSGDCAETLAPYQANPAYDPGAAQLADCPNQDWLGSHQPFYGTDAGGGFDGGVMTALDAYRPILMGLRWDEQFANPLPGGIMPAPGGRMAGYHEVLVYGRHPTSSVGEAVLAIRNSWGRWWGADGDFFMPISYLNSPGLIIDMRSVVGAAAAPGPVTPDVVCTLTGPATLTPGTLGTWTLGASGASQPLWNIYWGDGSGSDGWSADNVQKHTYVAPGAYTITAWAWDAATRVTSAATKLDVTVTAAPATTVEMEQLLGRFTDGSEQVLYQRGA